MEIDVRLTGLAFRDGQRQKKIEMPENARVKDALIFLENILPEGILEDKVQMLVVLLNKRHVRMDKVIEDGDELRILRSITGG